MAGLTDHVAVAALYDRLVTMAPSTGALVARPKAHAAAFGPAAGLRHLAELAGQTAAATGYQPYWVVRATYLLDAGDMAGAREAAAVAVRLTEAEAVRVHLVQRFGL